MKKQNMTGVLYTHRYRCMQKRNNFLAFLMQMFTVDSNAYTSTQILVSNTALQQKE